MVVLEMRFRTQPPTNAQYRVKLTPLFWVGSKSPLILRAGAGFFCWAFQEQRDLLELEQLQKEEMQKKLQDLEERSLDATEAARNFKLTKK